MNYSWKNWLKGEYNNHPGSEGEFIYIYQWVDFLFKDGIKPMIENKGYLFLSNDNTIITSILNFIYRLEMDFTYYKKNNIYIAPINNISVASVDDQEFFHSFMCPDYKWNKLRKEFYLDFYTSNSDFSDKLWIELPYFIFTLIDVEKSIASDILKERLTWDDDDNNDNSDPKKKKDIDPYLLDYGNYKKE